MKRRKKKTTRKNPTKTRARARRRGGKKKNPGQVPVRVANPRGRAKRRSAPKRRTNMAKRRKSGSKRRRRNPARSSRRHRRSTTHRRRRSNPSHARRRTSHRRRRHNPSVKGALMNAGKAILIGTGVTVVGIGGMWALSKISTTTTAGAVAKFAIAGIVGGGLVGMISPMAGALVAVMFLNVAGGAIVQALSQPKDTGPAKGLGIGNGDGTIGRIDRQTPQMGAVFADNLGAVFADNLGRVGLQSHARAIIEEGRARGLSDMQINNIVQMTADRRLAA